MVLAAFQCVILEFSFAAHHDNIGIVVAPTQDAQPKLGDERLTGAILASPPPPT